ncbi:MAG: SurA N-terminal domain-containing protein, partial [Anaerolineaceae bacterium]|nr:SurA N-terminal domain-containing protein [Anaerolineaceae bacterium]
MAKEQPSPQTVTKKHLARKQKEERQVKTALTITGIIIAIVLFLLAYVLIDNYIVKPNTVVARVGETEIKAKQFQSNTKYSRLNMINQANQYVSYFGEYGIEAARNMVLQLSDPTVVGETVLNQLIDEVIIREEAEKRGISVTDEEVEALMREQFNFYPDGTLTPTVTTTPVYTPTWSSAQIELIDPTATFTPSPEPTSTPEGWEPTASEPESEATTDAEVAP